MIRKKVVVAYLQILFYCIIHFEEQKNTAKVFFKTSGNAANIRIGNSGESL
jgi:hypothetical protein